MRFSFLITLLSCCLIAFGQEPKTQVFKKDSILVFEKNDRKGFQNEYILFIPKGTPMNKKTTLLVEPNNSGKVTDSMEVHKKHAIRQAAVSSVGNNVATNLRIPLLVPVFPRPGSKPLVYTHALDRDVMLEDAAELKRLDLQLIAMIKDAQSILAGMAIEVEPKIFMTGFSASGTFTNRFSILHPEMIKALAIGGFNGKLMLPQKKINKISLNYPIGINDFSQLFGKEFAPDAFAAIPQFIYMGALDDNDAVQFDDAYSTSERKIINKNLGSKVQERFVKGQKIYSENKVNAIFKTYENIGHGTTGEMNLEISRYFLNQMKAK